MKTNFKKLITWQLVVMLITLNAPVIGQEMFDDFYYSGVGDPELSNFSWYIRTGGGGPGPSGCSWSQNNISFVDEGNGNKLMRLWANTSGTGSSTSQSEISTSREYLEGTYAARIRFTDAPFSGSPDGDQINETFFTIMPLAYNMDPNYSEVDFAEYLANGGWGASGPNFWMTTWETYQPSPWVPVSQSDHISQSYAGWHIVSCIISGGLVKFYIDGVLKATHGGNYYPESIMSINFNLWFIDGGLVPSSSMRTYVEDIDWVYHAKNTVVNPADIPRKVSYFRSQGVLSRKINGQTRYGAIIPECNTVNIPGTIQAENWCNMFGVQNESTTDAGGGQNVG